MSIRDDFRNSVFERDGYKCIVCGESNKMDAHHIMERRLFPDGGYHIDNGATLCDPHCHMKAESTEYSTEFIRERAGIKNIILPPHLYKDEKYDKWGNPFLANGLRMRGDLFEDESVQKVLKSVLSQFTRQVKYPRTYHLPFSPGVTKDDRVLSISETLLAFSPDVVITEKMDGENTTFYNHYIHARSIDYSPHRSRDYVKSIWASVCGNIPDGWRVCGENVYAKHSVSYNDLDGYFLMFSIWNERNICLSWDETKEWAELLGLPLVPEVYRGHYANGSTHLIAKEIVKNGGEGIVVRIADSFRYGDFRRAVGKYVRENHVQTHGHWMRSKVEPNKVK